MLGQMKIGQDGDMIGKNGMELEQNRIEFDNKVFSNRSINIWKHLKYVPLLMIDETMAYLLIIKGTGKSHHSYKENQVFTQGL